MKKEPISGLESGIVGYFTLAQYSLRPMQTQKMGLNSGRYDAVPAILLGRMGLDAQFEGMGLGKALLLAAMATAFKIHEQLSATALVLHPINHKIQQFYERHGFQTLASDSDSNEIICFMKMNEIANLFSS